MALCLALQVRCVLHCRSLLRFNIFRVSQARLSLCTSVRKTNSDKSITSSSTFVQDGLVIQELPIVVRLINGEFILNKANSAREIYLPEVSKSIFKYIDFEEEQEMILGFVRCKTIEEIFKLLGTIPDEEVTPAVALALLRKIFELDNHFNYRHRRGDHSDAATFTSNAVINRLVDAVCSSNDTNIIVDALTAFCRCPIKNGNDKCITKLCIECILLLTEGKLTLSQICQVTRAFDRLGYIGAEYIEKVWVGIIDKADEVTENEVCDILSILPMLKKSQTIVHNTIEKRMTDFWHRLEPDKVIRILSSLVNMKLTYSKILPMISNWTTLHIHHLSEGDVRWIVYCFKVLNHVDMHLVKTLNKYMKLRGMKTRDPSVIALILDYCVKMQVRSSDILNIASNYLVSSSDSLSSMQVHSFVKSFGHLNYLPDNPKDFFGTLEIVLNDKFSEFSPNEIVDILLMCIFLKRYPVNFVSRIFNPYFFDKIESLDSDRIKWTRKMLKVIDFTLSTELTNFPGPLLPRESRAEHFWRDARILKCIKMLQTVLIEIAGTAERIVVCSIPSVCPVSELFVIDCIMDMKGRVNITSFKWKKSKYAFIVHPTEHYTRDGHLIGPQAFRERIIRSLGFTVVSLSLTNMSSLAVYPDTLKSYIFKQMEPT